GDLNEVAGVLSVKSLFNHLTKESFSKRAVLSLMEPPYFVPERIPLHLQLLEFQRHKKRLALVVDEYGDVQGLITLDDLLGEIVGEFTLDLTPTTRMIHLQADGSYLIDGSANIREINRQMGWNLPTSHASTTLSGLIIEQLECIPNPGTCLLIARHPVEVIRVKDNIVRTVHISPQRIPLPSNETTPVSKH
ncbi:CBS domain-containing protein, partial [bacterium]|nr:CBS domain-containing protein [bacterium]